MLTVQKSVGDYKTLKKAVVRLHKIWVLEETKQNNGSLDVDAFVSYMKSQGKLGGQNKVPRLSNDRLIADALEDFVEEVW